ncbi:MAG TPA: aldo/keto reductase [Candidatus Sulfotelmatobacter sp.]|nr:aldo/keto reductase [Candidatus Sulfotelmatobacter sp.]
MKNRQLGNSGIQVAPFMLGGNVFGWTADEPASFEVLDAFVGAGLNFIDTADSYSTWVPGHVGGESETIIGNWFKRSGKRDRVVIATKVGSEIPGQGKGLSRAWIIREAEASLKRLQTDHIDLYQSHRDDPNTPVEETLEAYAQLIQQGKVRAIGCSNFTAERIQESLAASCKQSWPRYESMQPHYNLYERAGLETTLEPLALRENLAVIPYYALASGFLTGKYRSPDDLSKSPRGQSVKKYLNDRGFRILQALDQVAEKRQATPAQVALAWLIARPGITAPIASATRVDQLNDLVRATELELDKASIDLLNKASAYEQPEKRIA